jgi:hypothetical protein
MQHGETDDNAQIFWPGYVDAISNLVLNLLFLVMILCLAVFVMSQTVNKKSKEGAVTDVPQETLRQEALPEQSTRLSSGGKNDQVQKQALIDVKPSPQGQAPGAVRIQSPIVSEQGVLLEMRFLEDALELSEASQQALRQQVMPFVREGFTQWELVVVTDTAFAATRRSALLRLLRVREALNQVAPDTLQSNTRIESGGSTEAAAVVRLLGRRASAAPQSN